MPKTIAVPEDLLKAAANKLSDLGQVSLSNPLFTLVNEASKAPDEGDAFGLEMAKKYPAYWRLLPEHWQAIDTYRINELFGIKDDSGRILHSRKKLLVPGVRTGGKTMRKDVQEAMATLQQWLDANPEREEPSIGMGVCFCQSGEYCTRCKP